MFYLGVPLFRLCCAKETGSGFRQSLCSADPVSQIASSASGKQLAYLHALPQID